MGEQSTLYYIRQLNALYKEKVKSDATCPLKMLQENFHEINRYLPFEFDRLEPLLKQSVLKLDKLGVGVILIPNITLHMSFDRLKLPVSLKKKVIHPLTEGIKYLQSKNVKEITLIGSRHTMQSNLFNQYFEAQNIKVKRPSEEDIAMIDSFRMEIYTNGPSKLMQSHFNRILSKYFLPVISCSELSILKGREPRFFDLIDHQIKTAFLYPGH